MNAVQPAPLSHPAPVLESTCETPLKIALLGYRSHPHVGGQGVYLRHLSKALVELGHDVDVISGPPYPELADRVGLIKLPSLNLYECKGHHWLALRPRHFKSWADLSEWGAMAVGRFGEPYSFGRRVKNFLLGTSKKYDIIHDNQSLGYGLLELQRVGMPVVATVHHPITRDRELAIAHAKSKRHKAGAKRWYSFVDMQVKVARELRHLITVSEFSKQDICEEFKCQAGRVEVIKNGVDVSIFRPLPELTRVPGRIITTSSADHALKGFSVLLHALKALLATRADAHLVVIGKLNPKGSSQKLLRSLALESRVQFISGISDEALNREYAQAQVAVCPSLYEGFGLPAAEAMAAGLPVVSSDGGALAEVVGDCGLLTRAGDAEQLAQAMNLLLADTVFAKELAQKGLARIHAEFCWRHAARSLTAFYRRQVIAPANAKN